MTVLKLELDRFASPQTQHSICAIDSIAIGLNGFHRGTTLIDAKGMTEPP